MRIGVARIACREVYARYPVSRSEALSHSNATDRQWQFSDALMSEHTVGSTVKMFRATTSRSFNDPWTRGSHHFGPLRDQQGYRRREAVRRRVSTGSSARQSRGLCIAAPLIPIGSSPQWGGGVAMLGHRCLRWLLGWIIRVVGIESWMHGPKSRYGASCGLARVTVTPWVAEDH